MLLRSQCARNICAKNDHLETVSFYDALNRRIGTDDNGTQIWTVYDGKSADAESYADFNGSGSLTVRYVHGPTVVNGAVTTGILARSSSGGTTAWYLTDNLGSVRDIVSPSGTELDHIVYDSFGNIVTETNASNGDRFKFAGMQYDAATQQYFDQARWYSPAQGRFLSQDPSGYAAGDANLYRYIFNGPTLGTDPSGMNAGLLVAGLVRVPTPASVIAGLVVAAGLATALVTFNVQRMTAEAQSAVLDAQLAGLKAFAAVTAAMQKMINVMAGVASEASDKIKQRVKQIADSMKLPLGGLVGAGGGLDPDDLDDDTRGTWDQLEVLMQELREGQLDQELAKLAEILKQEGKLPQ